MNNNNFSKLVEACCEEIRETLSKKATDYAGDFNRLQNFVDASSMTGLTPESCLWGFVVKHIVALQDYILRIDDTNPPSEEQLLEKVGDIICYMVLLRGLLADRGLLHEYTKRIGISND